MKRIILFRYHNKFERNRHLLSFLKYLNPGVEIYGLYGGPSETFAEASGALKELFAHNYLIEGKDKEWKWKHSDLAYQLWYKDFGHQVDFDMMHSVEWDLLYFEPLDKLFGHAGKDTLVLSGLVPVEQIEDRWYWTRHETERPEWNSLLYHFRKNFGSNITPYGIIGPGTSLPRSFLEKIKDYDIPRVSNDELRIPLLAQAFGFKMADTNFFRKWFSRREFRYFNSNALEVSMKTITKQLKKRSGRRAFHPYGGELDIERLTGLHQLTRVNGSPRILNLWHQ